MSYNITTSVTQQKEQLSKKNLSISLSHYLVILADCGVWLWLGTVWLWKGEMLGNRFDLLGPFYL